MALPLLAAAAPAEPSDQMRKADKMAVTALPLNDIQRCATRELSKSGRVTPVPIDGGVALDFEIDLLFGLPKGMRYSLQIVDQDGKRMLSSAYRHPLSNKAGNRLLQDVAKKCLPLTERQLQPVPQPHP